MRGLWRILACLVAIFALAAGEPARARHAMVVTREPYATDVGLSVLRAGGNAVDAAVAVGFALAVTHPQAGNLGGGGFLLARLAGGDTAFLDFRERAPRRATGDMYRAPSESRFGYRAAGVPGTVRGLEFAHRKYGRRPWPALVAPAIELARRGFPISADMARSLATSQRLASDPESRRVFLGGGSRLVQPDLARTIERISKDGARDFYEGETARLIDRAMAAHGGLVTLADLKDYAVAERRPLAGSYRGYDIVTAPPPSSGGVGLLEMLGILEDSDYQTAGAGSPAAIHYVAEAMRRAYADRDRYLADPDFVHVPVAGLLDERYLADLRRSIDPVHATASAALRPGGAELYEGDHTTHFSIVDGEGNAVSLTYTLNDSYGCGVTVPGTGVLLNDEMDDFTAAPNAIQAYKRPRSSMTPTIVARDGRLALVVGSPGGGTIINTVLQVLLNVVDFHMPLDEAVRRPRFYHQWKPDAIRLEPGFSADSIAGLQARGHVIEHTRSIGEVAAIRAENGWLQGVADPRVPGKAAGY
jgi:gamma-glutamyltranspeptidase / glutathione hydrolase